MDLENAIFYEFFKNNEKSKIWYNFYIFDMKQQLIWSSYLEYILGMYLKKKNILEHAQIAQNEPKSKYDSYDS